MKMKNNFHWIYVCGVSIFLLSIFHFPSTLSAACIGGIAVVGTGDTNATCRAKKNQTEVPDEPPDQTINEGRGSGKGNTNIFLDDPVTDRRNSYEQSSSDFIPTVHQIRAEMALYMIPGAYQFDEGGMPERTFPNGLAYEYSFNKTLSFGFLYQQWSKNGGKDFDPITYKDSSGDVHSIASPGAINRLKYELYLPYIAVNAPLSPRWHLGLRFGIGRVEVEAEYNESKIKSGNSQYSDNTSMLVDMFVEYWVRGFRLGGFLRYIQSQHETTNYLEYMNLGSAQFGISCQFTLETLGVL